MYSQDMKESVVMNLPRGCISQFSRIYSHKETVYSSVKLDNLFSGRNILLD